MDKTGYSGRPAPNCQPRIGTVFGHRRNERRRNRGRARANQVSAQAAGGGTRVTSTSGQLILAV
eukprot:1976937-Pleurochrysis_carterae.AAC.4